MWDNHFMISVNSRRRICVGESLTRIKLMMVERFAEKLKLFRNTIIWSLIKYNGKVSKTWLFLEEKGIRGRTQSEVDGIYLVIRGKIFFSKLNEWPAEVWCIKWSLNSIKQLCIEAIDNVITINNVTQENQRQTRYWLKSFSVTRTCTFMHVKGYRQASTMVAGRYKPSLLSTEIMFYLTLARLII